MAVLYVLNSTLNISKNDNVVTKQHNHDHSQSHLSDEEVSKIQHTEEDEDGNLMSDDSHEPTAINRAPGNTKDEIVFSFDDQVKNVNQLSKKYPKSKPQLISIITEEDPFKSQESGVKPHTTDVLVQRKIGAVKVLALNTLLSKELNKDQLKRDLINIARTAKDPTISEIAKAALKSEEDGRSLVDDFSDGIDTAMPE